MVTWGLKGGKSVLRLQRPFAFHANVICFVRFMCYFSVIHLNKCIGKYISVDVKLSHHLRRCPVIKQPRVDVAVLLWTIGTISD